MQIYIQFVAYPFRSIVYDNPTQIISYSRMHEQSLLQVINGNMKQTFPLISISHPKALPDVYGVCSFIKSNQSGFTLMNTAVAKTFRNP